jgi:hypothetical protein
MYRDSDLLEVLHYAIRTRLRMVGMGLIGVGYIGIGTGPYGPAPCISACIIKKDRLMCCLI